MAVFENLSFFLADLLILWSIEDFVLYPLASA